ncbi:MAG: 30S ribosomal protein S1 [Lactobacillales bacterium]|jgi:small subunit ribosomal protein S1|nr:30S ribosomal protein S1 [Lactobacillales bacterium]
MSDFESLLNAQEDVKIGDVVKAVVEQVDESKKQLIVSLPGGVQGVVPIRELSVEPIKDITIAASVGDEVELVVSQEVRGIAQDEGLTFILSKNKLLARATWNELVGKEGESLHVKVVKAVKGGLSVAVKGLRGFIPASMVADRFVSDLSKYVGQEFDAKIIEVDPLANRLILSRRALLEADRKAEKTKILESLHEGDIVEGVVARLTDFGAFVNLGGIDGLIHISELAHHRVSNPAEILFVGESVNVKILKVDSEKGRLSLSLKATLPSPWDGIEEKAAVGTVLKGTVKRLTDFGAFLEIFPGVEGLVHISQIAHDHVENLKEKLKLGDAVEVKVLELIPEERRIGLSMKALLEKSEEVEEVPSSVEKEIEGQGSKVETD